MALNWYLTLRNLSKSDATAEELFNLLQKAKTDEEKESAKKRAQEYIAQTTESKDSVPEETVTTAEEIPVDEDKGTDVDPNISPVPVDNEQELQEDTKANTSADEEKIKTDLAAPAFNPRLAKCGITREEELFLNHVFVRKLSHEEKILMRRSIYQKKTQRNAQIQAEYKAKRIAQKMKDLTDPEKIKFHQERKLVSAIVDALEQHKNLAWIFSQIEGLTPDVFRELIQKPGNVNAFTQANPVFLDNFKKMYGE